MLLLQAEESLQYVECIVFGRRCSHFRGEKLDLQSIVLYEIKNRRLSGGFLATQQACAFWWILFY